MKRHRWFAASLQIVSDREMGKDADCTILQPSLEATVAQGRPWCAMCRWTGGCIFWETRSQHEQTTTRSLSRYILESAQ